MVNPEPGKRIWIGRNYFRLRLFIVTQMGMVQNQWYHFGIGEFTTHSRVGIGMSTGG